MRQGLDSYEIISKEFSVELYENTKEILIDYSELTLDSIFKDELASEVPIIKTLASIYKTGVAVRERFFAKKLLKFLEQYHSGYMDNYKKKEFFKKMEDKKYRKKVTDTLMIFIDGFREESKLAIYANLLNSHIGGLFNWDKFIHFSNCLDMIFLQDLELLRHYYCIEKVKDYLYNPNQRRELSVNNGALNRLEYLGFLESRISQSIDIGNLKINGNNQVLSKVNYSITDDGILFYESGCV